MQYFIGCSGFYYDEWKGIFYPKELSKKDWLHFYTNHFNAVEINATFYHNPSENALRNWHDNTPGNFLFSLKAPRVITHLKKFSGTQKELQHFYSIAEKYLKNKLGCILFQMPPLFKYSDEHLSRIVNALNNGCRNVVEFRDKSWWRQDVFNRLCKQDIIFCGQSHPSGIPDKLIVNNPDFCYYRFHGKPVLYKSVYGNESLSGTASAIKKAKKNAFVFFNNTWGNGALQNARTMQSMLS